MPVTAIHVIIHGRVQGVGFRRFTLEHAQGLTGFVRNLQSGEVEALFVGEDPNSIIEKLKNGPGDVKAINVKAVTPKDLPTEFQILKTAISPTSF